MKAVPVRWSIPDPFYLLALLLLFGYALMSRTFAHVGLRPFFIGELSLAAFFLVKPVAIVQPWFGSLAMPTKFSTFSWWLALSILYGIMEFMRAFFTGPMPLMSAEIFVVHLYPLYLFAGAWVGLRNPELLPKLIRALAWCHGLYGMAFILILSPAGLTENHDNPHVVGWFGHPGACPVMLLGLLAFETSARRAAIPFLLNTLVLLGMQRRAEWLALAMAVTLWACLAHRVKQLLYCGGLVMAVLLIGLLPGVRFPSPDLRGESLSTRDLVGRAIAPIDAATASELTREAESHAATASWRSDFWRAIWKEVHATELDTIFGLGYDYPIWRLHPDNLNPETPTRTPHSIFLFVVGYSGWLGAVIFFGLQFSIAQLLWRSYRESGESFGICVWVLAIVWALFDPLLDRPFGAIPLYLLMGMAAVYTGTPAARRLRAAHRLSSNGTSTGTSILEAGT